MTETNTNEQQVAQVRGHARMNASKLAHPHFAFAKIGMTIEESSEYTGIGRNTMRKLVEWNKLPVLRVGRKVIIRRDILERFMAANEGRNLRNEHDVKAVRN